MTMKRPLRMHLFHEAFTGLTLVRRVCLALVAAAALILASSATAAWNTAPETIQQHPTWIYTPSTLMNNGKHVLLVALHGCDQSHDQIKNFGNLDGTAEANAIVVAVPSVGAKVWSGNPLAKCWDYNGANDAQKDI